MVKRQPVFGFDERVTAAILEKFSLNLYQPEWKVTEQGEYPNKIFFLVRGDCDIFKVLTSSIPLFVGSIKAGVMFGEIEAIFNSRNSTSVVCKNFCTIAKLRVEDYFMIAMRFPRMAEKMSYRIKANYKDPVTNFFMYRYKRIEYLAELDTRIVEEISCHLYVVIYKFN